MTTAMEPEHTAKPEQLARMRELVDQIEHHNYSYYTLDEPSISDKDYDLLYDELVQLEQSTGIILPDSATSRVGGDILKGFDPHRHLARLWSLDKAQDHEDLLAWNARVCKTIADYNSKNPEAAQLPDPSYVIELKFDGLTLNLTYDEGRLVQASTRGNGVIGEGILAQVKTIMSIPLTIPFIEWTY